MQDKPSVLHVARGLDPKLGGTSSAIPALARYAGESGRIESSLAVFRTAGDRCDIRALGLPESHIHEIPWRASSPLGVAGAYSRLSALIHCQQVVQVHGLWQSHTSMAAYLSRSLRKPYIVSAHGMLDAWALRNKAWKKRLYAGLIERSTLQKARCLSALTRSEVSNYRDFGLRTPIAVVPNGVAAPAQITPDLFLEKWPGLAGKRVVLFLSRVHYKKGLDILCRAWTSVSRLHSDAHLVVAGPDSEETQARIEKMVADEGLTQSVTFTGMLDYETKWSALSAASLFVLPSYSEGFSMAILEALAAGKPVVITRQCNFPELEGRDFATVIEPDAAELAEALDAVLRIPSAGLLERGESARRFVGSRYSWPQVGAAMADVYEWMLGGGIPTSVEMVLN